MQYEDIVYPAGILAMAVRLEKFLREQLKGVVGPDDGLGALIRAFKNKCEGEKFKSQAVELMSAINERRKDCAHPSGRKITGAHIRVARKKCAQLDGLMEKNLGKSPELGKIMVSCSLRYDMGNAGDIIKHGVLAEFVRWWCKSGRKIRYADPFGGRPWGVARPAAASRVESMHKQGFALGPAQKAGEQLKTQEGITTYYGSSHVVRNAASAFGGGAVVFADDIDKLAREDLKASGLSIINDSPDFPRYKPDDGYAVLDHAAGARLDLVLIDPYKEFMRDEFSDELSGRDGAPGSPLEKRFANIIKVTKQCPNLWVAVFVLDWKETNRRYQEFKEGFLGERAIGLRCKRLKGKKRLDGENSYDMEVVLVSERLRHKPDKRMRALLRRMAELERGVAGAIRGSNVSSFGIEGRLRE